VRPDHLLLLEHPHVITLGRNGHMENLLATEVLTQRIQFHPPTRGDITYHGPGQLVGYPIMDLRDWARRGRLRARRRQVLIDTLAEFESGGPPPRLHRVWVGQAKIAAIRVHISRWVTSTASH
jgi:lipoate-protein ligase B